MIWLSWRQQRLETLVAAALLAALAALLVPAGIHIADAFAQLHVARCVDRQDSAACAYVLGNFGNSGGFVRGLVSGGWLNLIPGLIGVALAVPLLLDLEQGTTRLAWTQSVTRRRWLATKGMVAIGTALVAGVVFSVLFTWYERPLDRVWGRWDQFGFEGVVPVAYVLFGLGLALAVGVLLRRSGAALVLSFGAYVAARLFVQSWLRQRFATPLGATWGPRGSGPDLSHAWVVQEGPSDKAGVFFHGDPLAFQSCVQSHPFKAVGPHLKMGGPRLNPHCLTRIGAGFTHVVYQPASRFWEFQGMETALFGGIAALLVAFAAWRVLRTD